MKTIICGPPHSGKSVFISNLVRLMPSEAFQRINANGDGEGTWSNNPNQTEVRSVRIKGTNTEKDFQFWKSLIESAVQQIVLVDIGGKLQEDKAPLFEACDSFIVVSSSEDMSKWIRFGESHGCKCIGTVLSIIDKCEEEILSLSFPVILYLYPFAGIYRRSYVPHLRNIRANNRGIALRRACRSHWYGTFRRGSALSHYRRETSP